MFDIATDIVDRIPVADAAAGVATDASMDALFAALLFDASPSLRALGRKLIMCMECNRMPVPNRCDICPLNS